MKEFNKLHLSVKKGLILSGRRMKQNRVKKCFDIQE